MNGKRTIRIEEYIGVHEYGTDIRTDQVLPLVSMTIYLILAVRLLRAFSVIVLSKIWMQSAATSILCCVKILSVDVHVKTAYEYASDLKFFPIQFINCYNALLAEYQCSQQAQLHCTYLNLSFSGL